MTYVPGDPGHLQVHTDLINELAGMGATVLPALPVLGASTHVADHNALIDAIEEVAANWGVTGVPLPPPAVLGASDHVADHNALAAAVEYLNVNGYNKVTGGTVKDITDTDGKKYRIHTYESTRDITVESNPRPFHILCIGGGANGGQGDYGAYGGGGGGFTEIRSGTLPRGTVRVTVGAGGGGASSIATYSAEGAKGGNGVPGAGGGWGAGNGGQGQDGASSRITGEEKWYSGGGSSVNWNYCCDPCCFGGVQSKGGGGSGRDCAPQGWYYGGGGGRAQHTCGAPFTGYQGVVIVRYEIL